MNALRKNQIANFIEKMEGYSVTTPDELRLLCIRNGWFTCGTNRQYDLMFYANENGCSIEEIASMIWMCSDTETIARRDILAELNKAHDEYMSRQPFDGVAKYIGDEKDKWSDLCALKEGDEYDFINGHFVDACGEISLVTFHEWELRVNGFEIVKRGR